MFLAMQAITRRFVHLLLCPKGRFAYLLHKGDCDNGTGRFAAPGAGNQMRPLPKSGAPDFLAGALSPLCHEMTIGLMPKQAGNQTSL